MMDWISKKETKRKNNDVLGGDLATESSCGQVFPFPLVSFSLDESAQIIVCEQIFRLREPWRKNVVEFIFVERVVRE